MLLIASYQVHYCYVNDYSYYFVSIFFFSIVRYFANNYYFILIA